jgi:hypothetical protein
VHDGDLVGEAREERRLFHGGIAAADDGDVVTAEEIAVARGAGGHAVAHERALRRQSQEPRRSAGGDDDGLRRVLSISRRDDKRRRGQVYFRDVALDDLGAESQRLRAHVRNEVGPHDAVAVPRPVLDQRCEHELTASFQPFNHQRLHVGAGGIQGCGESGRPGPNNDDGTNGHQRCLSMTF